MLTRHAAENNIQKLSWPKKRKKVLHCPYLHCLKQFSEASNILTHLRIHTNMRPFPCLVCTKRFRNKAHLQTHMFVHIRKKDEMRCDLCSALFASQDSLIKHYMTHNQKDIYSHNPPSDQLDVQVGLQSKVFSLGQKFHERPEMPPHQSSDAGGPDPYHTAVLAKQTAANSQPNR